MQQHQRVWLRLRDADSRDDLDLRQAAPLAPLRMRRPISRLLSMGSSFVAVPGNRSPRVPREADPRIPEWERRPHHYLPGSTN